MKRLVTIAEFPHQFDVKLSLLKDLLEEAGIPFITTNENYRSSKPLVAVISNISIEVRVYEDDLPRALELLNSIS